MFKAAIIVLLLLPNICSADSTSANSNYFRYINKAELLIIEEKYNKSLIYFDSAFSVAKPLAKDLHNCILASLKSGKKDKLKTYSFMLAEKGVGSKYFQLSAIRGLEKEKYWKELTQKANQSKDFFAKRNADLGAKLSNLNKVSLENEQNFRSLNADYPNDEIRNISDSVAIILMKLMPANRLFSEDDLGAALQGDSVITSFPDFNIIMMRTFSTGGIRVKDQLSDRIDNTLAQNLISPDDASFFWDTGGSYFDKPTGNFSFLKLVDCQLYRSSLPPMSTAEIEKFRERKMLCSLEEMEKKLIFNIKDSSGFIIYPQPKNLQIDPNFKSFYLSNTQLIMPDVKNCK